MKNLINITYRLGYILLTLMLFVNCQEDEVIIDNPPVEETIEINAPLFNVLITMAENEGSLDDIIDGTPCASIALPVTLIVNGVEITIDTIADIALILKVYDETDTDEDILELLFPITLVLSDYSTTIIENQNELNTFIENCTPVLPPCVDFVYPVSFSVFNLEFEFIETVSLSSDFELYFFLQNLNEAEQIVNLNYPVSLLYDNGNTVQVNTNEALATAIEVAPQNCEGNNSNNNCPANEVTAQLLDCFWAPTFYDGSPIYQFYHFTFFENNTLTVSTDTSLLLEGEWDVFEEGDDTYLSLQGAPSLFNPFAGIWKITECLDGQFILENNEDVQILFTRDCGVDWAQCFASGQAICDDNGDGIVTVNFSEIIQQSNCNVLKKYSINFYLTNQDALAGTNPLNTPFETTIPNSQLFYYAIVDASTNDLLYVSTYQIDAEECDNCDNPGVLLEDLIVYIPFGNEVHELISNTFFNLTGAYVEDRNGNPSCSVGFIGGNAPISIPITDQNRITNENAFSISLWFKMQNENAGDFEPVFSNTSQPFQEGFSVNFYDLNTPLFTANDDSLWDLDWNEQNDVEWTNTDWHHLVITVSVENEIKLYRDGVLRNETVVNQLNIDTNPPSEAYVINAGGFEGHLDDLRVYKKALNENEINILFNLEGDCFDCL